MCTLKDVSIPIYTTILNDDGRYKKGFFDEYSTNQAVELPNSEIQPLFLHLYVDRAEKSGKDLSNKDS